MALHLFCYSSLEVEQVQEILPLVKIEHGELFADKFLISHVMPATDEEKETALENKLHALSLFLIRLNARDASDFMPEVVLVIKAALRDANVVILIEGESRL